MAACNSISKTSLHSVVLHSQSNSHSIYKYNDEDSYFHHTNNLSNAEVLRLKAIACQNAFAITSISSKIEEEDEENHDCGSVESAVSQSQKKKNHSSLSKPQTCIKETEEGTASPYADSSANKGMSYESRLKTSSNELTYSSRLMANMLENQRNPDEFLINHSIIPDVRAKMVDWMIEVTSNYGCTDQTFYLSVEYMDLFFARVSRSLCPNDLHLTGVACMFIACKYEEVCPQNLNTFFEKIGHKKLAKEDIKRREQEIMHAVDFNLCSPTIGEFINATVNQLDLEARLSPSQIVFFTKMSGFLSKLVCHEYKILMRFSNSTIAGAIIFVSIKILQQMDNQINLVEIVQKIISVLLLENEEILKSSTLVLSLARNFEKNYPNLTNLKKLSADIQSLSAAATPSSNSSPVPSTSPATSSESKKE